MAGRDPRTIARQMWDHYTDAEAAWRRSPDKSPEEQQAVQTMALTAMAALQAEQADY